jgi:LPS O-antigen subunit length determinant protein (WzzB/FepE family)
VFEFGEWLSAQPIYTPQQVAEIKNQFNHRVAEMDANQLSILLADLQAKMKILNSPDAVEARAWLAQYLSVISDSKRAALLRDVPNVATMTAAQLAAEISKIEEKRAQMDNEQTAFRRGQALQVANQLATDRTSQQNFVRGWNSGPSVVSPYRGQSNVNERLNNTQIGPGMTIYSGGLGAGVAFSPSAW